MTADQFRLWIANGVDHALFLFGFMVLGALTVALIGGIVIAANRILWWRRDR